MRNLDIADSRSRLEGYVSRGLIGGTTGELIGALEKGEAEEITAGTEADEALDAAGESAAFDTGTD